MYPRSIMQPCVSILPTLLLLREDDDREDRRDDRDDAEERELVALPGMPMTSKMR